MFAQKTFDFLMENRFQNSKTWFEEHKPDFNEYVITPIVELTNTLTQSMLDIDGNFNCEPKVGKCLSRIYRDVRFSKDKSLYRDVMWIVFMREKNSITASLDFSLIYRQMGFVMDVVITARIQNQWKP